MDGVHDEVLLTDTAALRELYGEPPEGAIAKEIDYVHPHYRAMIEASPFMVMATSGPDGSRRVAARRSGGLRRGGG